MTLKPPSTPTDPVVFDSSRLETLETTVDSLVLSVRDPAYGAVGDNVTDDKNAIQATITAVAAAGGGTVYLPATSSNIYRIKTGLSQSSNVKIVSAPGVTLKAGSTFPVATALISVAGSSSNCEIVGLNLHGNNLAQAGVNVAADHSNFRMRGCTIQALRLQALDGSAHAAGVDLRNGTNWSVENCYIKDIVAATPNAARGVRWADTGTGQGGTVSGCLFEDIEATGGVLGDADGVVIQTFTNDVDAVITNNVFRTMWKRGVKIQSPGVTVSENVIDNPSLGSGGGYGTPDPITHAAISLLASRCSAIGNKIRGGSAFLSIEAGSGGSSYDNIVIAENQIDVLYYVGADVSNLDPIRAYGTQTNLVIRGNIVRGGRYSIRITSVGTGLTITGNALDGQSVSGTRGVYIEGAGGVYPTRVSITGNVCTGMASAGIYWAGGNDYQLSANQSNFARSVASATTVLLRAEHDFYTITGTTDITTIDASCSATGRIVTLQFASNPTLKHGTGNLVLTGAADVTTTANDIIRLIFNGTSWIQCGTLVAI